MAEFIKKGLEGEADQFLEVPEGSKAPTGFTLASELFSGTTGQETATIRPEDTGIVTPLITPKDVLQQAGGVTSADLATGIEDIRTREETRLGELQGIIGGQFSEAIGERKERGVAEIGGTKAQLGISRGLGVSSSRQGFIAAQQSQIDKDIRALETAKATALTNADFASADREDRRIQQLKDNQFRLQQANFENTLALLGEQRVQEQFGRQRSQDRFNRLESIAFAGGEPTPEDIEALDLEFGEGFAQNFISASQEIQQAETEEQEQKAALNLTKFLLTLPEGKTIEIGGVEYQGLGEVDEGLKIFREKDSFGNVTFVTLDKEGNIVNTTSGGRIGAGVTGGGGIPGITPPSPEVPTLTTFEDFIAQKEQELQQSLTPERREEFRDEFESLQVEQEAINANSPSNLDKQLKNKIFGMGLTKNVREFTIGEFNDRLSQGDIQGAKEVIDKLGAPLSQTVAVNLADSAAAIPSLGRLEALIQERINKFGPIKGLLSQVNKFDIQAQTVQAQINLVKQLVGKGLEGGVLRKEDEEKYKKILAQLNDEPQVALNKLKIIKREISSKIQIQLDFLGATGKSVSDIRLEVGNVLNEGEQPTTQPIEGGGDLTDLDFSL